MTDAEDVSPARLTPATAADVPAVVALMNRAYRGNPGAGWNSEAAYITGDRTNETLLGAEIAARGGAALLLWRRPDATLRGCVWLTPEDDGSWYLGSLTIEPREQSGGRGGALLRAAEGHVRAAGGREIRMRVVNVRDALLAWYAQRGYALTGETEPFPYGDDRFGTPLRDDLRFVVLRKLLA